MTQVSNRGGGQDKFPLFDYSYQHVIGPKIAARLATCARETGWKYEREYFENIFFVFILLIFVFVRTENQIEYKVEKSRTRQGQGKAGKQVRLNGRYDLGVHKCSDRQPYHFFAEAP